MSFVGSTADKILSGTADDPSTVLAGVVISAIMYTAFYGPDAIRRLVRAARRTPRTVAKAVAEAPRNIAKAVAEVPRRGVSPPEFAGMTLESELAAGRVVKIPRLDGSYTVMDRKAFENTPMTMRSLLNPLG